MPIWLRKVLGIVPGETYPADGGVLETELSRQLVRLVDVVYALVLVQGAIFYRRVFTEEGYFEHSTRFFPVALALLLIYYITIQSFVDYHLAAEDERYKILTEKDRALDLSRFYLDLIIVGSYSFILLRSHPLIDNSAADISLVFWALPGVFFLYYIWGELRSLTSNKATSVTRRPYRPILLVIMFGLYLLLAIAYTQAPGGSLRNSSALAAALFLMLAYRGLNSSQNRHY
jgi:hypothetical protein